MSFEDYDEETILRKIQQFNWRSPQDTDANSTNCLLNGYANMIHKKKYKYNPYSFELAKLVREGNLDRDAALLKLNAQDDMETIELVRGKLNFTNK